MHRLTSTILTGLAVLLAWAAPVAAQSYRANVQLTIDNTAAGISFTASDLRGPGHPQVNSASCISNVVGGDFRYRVDGTAPTADIGVLVPAGQALVFQDPLSLVAFKAIRTAATDAVLNCTLFSATTPGVTPGGGNPFPSSIAAFVAGNLANDTDAATANRLTTLPCITLTSAPTWTNGRDAACRAFAWGSLAVTLTDNAGAPYTFSTDDPCTSGTKVTVVVDIVTIATTEIANASVGNKLYICSINLVAGGAQSVAIVEDDTDACATPTAGLNGGVTAAEGWVFAANGGIALPATGFAHFETSTTNRYVCIITSAAQQLSGNLKYVLAP